MPSLQLYDKLLQYPLFRGLSRSDLEHIAGHTRFGFLKLPAGRTVVSAGEPATGLYLLVGGTLRVESAAPSGAYVVEEQAYAPFMVQPGALFGYHQLYTLTCTTLTDSSFLHLSREEVVRLSDEFLVVRINLLGLFATRSQQLSRRLWAPPPADLCARIARFLAARVVLPTGAKTVHILMTHLAREVGDSRLDVSRALNRMQAEGLIELHRGRIYIPDMQRLME